MVINLGQVSAIHKGASAPTNTQLIWYNTTDGRFYTYNTITLAWNGMATVSTVVRTLAEGDNDVVHGLGSAPKFVGMKYNGEPIEVDWIPMVGEELTAITLRGISQIYVDVEISVISW
jgi:hypothetical protein